MTIICIFSLTISLCSLFVCAYPLPLVVFLMNYIEPISAGVMGCMRPSFRMDAILENEKWKHLGYIGEVTN